MGLLPQPPSGRSVNGDEGENEDERDKCIGEDEYEIIAKNI